MARVFAAAGLRVRKIAQKKGGRRGDPAVRGAEEAELFGLQRVGMWQKAGPGFGVLRRSFFLFLFCLIQHPNSRMHAGPYLEV